jgi:hypothetical protein
MNTKVEFFELGEIVDELSDLSAYMKFLPSNGELLHIPPDFAKVFIVEKVTHEFQKHSEHEW